MATGNQRQRLSMLTLTALGLICLSLLPATDSTPLCPELLNVVKLFLTGDKGEYLVQVKKYSSSTSMTNTAEKIKNCVDANMTTTDQKESYDFVKYLSQDVCQKIL